MPYACMFTDAMTILNSIVSEKKILWDAQGTSDASGLTLVQNFRSRVVFKMNAS